MALSRRPEQRDSLGRVAHIVAREIVEHRIDAILQHLAEDAAKRQSDEQPVGQRGERKPAIGVGRRGEIVRQAASLSLRDGV